MKCKKIVALPICYIISNYYTLIELVFSFNFFYICKLLHRWNITFKGQQKVIRIAYKDVAPLMRLVASSPRNGHRNVWQQ